MSNELSDIAKDIAEEKKKMAEDLERQEREGIEKVASQIMNGLKRRVIQAVRERRTELCVMSCGGNFTDPEMLTGAARLVYDACLKAKLDLFLKTSSEKIPLNDDYNYSVHIYIKL